jgi:hypothetical protein
MSRLVTLVVTGISTVALATVAGPFSPSLGDLADTLSGGQAAGKTGNWCC